MWHCGLLSVGLGAIATVSCVALVEACEQGLVVLREHREGCSLAGRGLAGLGPHEQHAQRLGLVLCSPRPRLDSQPGTHTDGQAVPDLRHPVLLRSHKDHCRGLPLYCMSCSSQVLLVQPGQPSSAAQSGQAASAQHTAQDRTASGFALRLPKRPPRNPPLPAAPPPWGTTRMTRRTAPSCAAASTVVRALGSALPGTLSPTTATTVPALQAAFAQARASLGSSATILCQAAAWWDLRPCSKLVLPGLHTGWYTLSSRRSMETRTWLSRRSSRRCHLRQARQASKP